MAVLVEEVMNRELFSTSRTEHASYVLSHMLTLGITGAPVLDEHSRPLGMVTLRDLVGCPADTRVSARMNVPPMAIRARSSLQEAGKLMAELDYHHLIVVDEDGKAAGMVSSLDILRGLLGLPVRHPPAFPHFDKRTGLVWTGDTPLDLAQVEAAPAGPGIFLLIHGGKGIPERVVWAETAGDVRARLVDILTLKQEPGISFWIEQGNLRFRAASILRAEARQHTLAMVLTHTGAGSPRA